MIDITRELHNQLPNWPGDTPFKLSDSARMAEGSSVNIMQFSSSTHCGTHIDAPYHYVVDGPKLASIPLELLIGPCLVIHATGYQTVPASVLDSQSELPERLLFYTGQAETWASFPADFCPLSVELVEALADRGVRLVGTDSPSVDAFESKGLPVHQAFARAGLVIVEGLKLTGVAEGKYELICLPLNMPEADASPVRAILR